MTTDQPLYIQTAIRLLKQEKERVPHIVDEATAILQRQPSAIQKDVALTMALLVVGAHFALCPDSSSADSVPPSKDSLPQQDT